MTAEDRVNAIAEFGFTPRQARFLVLVMRHAGVSLLRQYSTRLPIGIDNNGRAVFMYLVEPTTRDDLRAFLRRHTPLFEALPQWTLRLVFPRGIAHAYAGYQAVVRDELETPLQPRTVDELKWYFEQLRMTRAPGTRLGEERFLRAAIAFEGTRFSALYRSWLREGDRTLERGSSTVINEALAAGNGRVESLVLPHRYDHLSPLAKRPEPLCDEPRVWRRESTEATLAPLHP